MQQQLKPSRILLVLFGLLFSSAGCSTLAFAQTEQRFQADLQAAMPEKPYMVAIGVQVDQITHVDQKSENYGIVGNLRLEWDDPKLVFDAHRAGQDLRLYSLDAFTRFVDENGLFAPGFVIHNQQGRRFSQQINIVVSENGHAAYLERFSATLQAPDFDFVQYPFDTQKFFVHVDAIHPTGFMKFVPVDGLMVLSGTPSQLTSNWTVNAAETAG